MSLLIHLAQIPDFCQLCGKLRHPLPLLLVISLLLVLREPTEDFEEINDFGLHKQAVLS